jgi:putative hydrolase of the HAD superfamily
MEIHLQTLEIALRGMSKLVIAECGEEVTATCEPGKLARDDRPASRGLRPDLGGVNDLPGGRNGGDAGELDPLDVADDRASHPSIIAQYGWGMRAVLWDFDGTLAFRAGMWRGCLIEVLDDHEPGHAFTADDVRPALRDGFPWHTPDVAHSHLDTADAWWEPVEALLARAYSSVGFEEGRAGELARLARARYVDPTRNWSLFEDTRASLEHLQEAGWRHVILSNHVPELDAIVTALGLDDLVTAIVNSAVTGYEKPHPEAFAAGRRAAGDPTDLWMVGDNPVADVAGAESAGIRALLARDGGAGLASVVTRISHSAAV